MIFCRKNKNELLVLTGAVYAFVAYLTAFSLEVLFIIDLEKRTSNQLKLQQHQDSAGFSDEELLSASTARPSFLEAIHTHMTISCLATSILYFVLFVASLILIVALILRNTFFLLIWMCVMATMYLPELGLILYVCIYGWGLDTRNGQTEILFYLFRAALNVIFIVRAHRLLKEWNYQKNFFMLKKAGGHRSPFLAGAYDTPYFIGGAGGPPTHACGGSGGGGDSLTTTINPMFSASSSSLNLNLNRYDQVRDIGPLASAVSAQNTANKFSSPLDANNNNNNHNNKDSPLDKRRQCNNIFSDFSNLQHIQDLGTGGKYSVHSSSRESRLYTSRNNNGVLSILHNYNNNNNNKTGQQAGGMRDSGQADPLSTGNHKHYSSGGHYNTGFRSSLADDDDDDDFGDCEMDLDYRTITSRKGYSPESARPSPTYPDSSAPVNRRHNPLAGLRPGSRLSAFTSGTLSALAHGLTGSNRHTVTSTGSSTAQSHLGNSTQSLDRRRLRDLDLALTEQVVLRPLNHRPFEYLNRPGSTSNLSTNVGGSNLDTQPSSSSLITSSNLKLSKRL